MIAVMGLRIAMEGRGVTVLRSQIAVRPAIAVPGAEIAVMGPGFALVRSGVAVPRCPAPDR
jgi:hypothetical protein